MRCVNKVDEEWVDGFSPSEGLAANATRHTVGTTSPSGQFFASLRWSSLLLFSDLVFNFRDTTQPFGLLPPTRNVREQLSYQHTALGGNQD
jgi:hypothetical protein